MNRKLLFSFLFGLMLTMMIEEIKGDSQTRGGANAPLLTPSYKISLDVSPLERWNEVVKAYNQSMWQTVLLMESWIPADIRTPVTNMLAEMGAHLEQYFPAPFAQEMQGIAQGTGIPPGLVVLSNLVYELTSACTSIVAQANNGTIFHARNLDFGYGGPFTADLTVDALAVDFVEANQLVYTGVTYAGYVGLLTGERPGFFTVSVDEHLGPFWEIFFNALEELYNHRASMVSLLIRQNLYSNTYQQALESFSYHPLAAEVYLIVGGVAPGEGAVITRLRNFPEDIWKIDTSVGRWFLVETNYPHWKPDPPSDDRATVAIQQMKLMGQDNLSFDGLWNVLSTIPVLNLQTTYTSLMYSAPSGPPHILSYARHCGSTCPE